MNFKPGDKFIEKSGESEILLMYTGEFIFGSFCSAADISFRFKDLTRGGYLLYGAEDLFNLEYKEEGVAIIR